jgi:sugar/nucleoside kinase (ribokinase family)
MPDRQYDVVTISDSCVDLLLYGNVVPRFGQVEQVVDDYLLEMGGSCAIFACQAAKLGLKTGILGRVGEDDFGRLVLRRLQECGVDTRHMIVDPSLKTGVGVALCKENDRAILTYMGSICAVKPEDVTDDFLASSRHLHHGSFFLQTRLMDAMPDIFRRARRLGLSTSLDTNWDPREEWSSTLPELFPLTDIFMPNEQEAMLISRCSSVEAALEWYRQAGVPQVVLKQGDKGASVSSEEGTLHMPVQPVTGGDSVGTGDSFDAGFLAGWLRDLPLSQCLEIGCRCGRAVAGAIGGLKGQPKSVRGQTTINN